MLNERKVTTEKTWENGGVMGFLWDLPSGKPLHQHGKATFFDGKTDYKIYKWPFSMALLVITRG